MRSEKLLATHLDRQASHLVIGVYTLELRVSLRALGGRRRTARVEAAAGWQINGVGGFALKDHPLPPSSGIGDGNH